MVAVIIYGLIKYLDRSEFARSEFELEIEV